MLRWSSQGRELIMIEVDISKEMLDHAKIRAEKLGTLRNSITKGEGNIAGILGELAVQKVMGGEIKDTRNYDILLPDETKVDVKTKRCRSQPSPHYECSISDYNTMQKCDKYIFVRVLENYTKAWILGSKEKEKYYNEATFIQQGQLDPSNGWRAKCDCWNLPITNLDPITPFDNGTEEPLACSQMLPE
jgi:hypothetical protein